MAPDGRAHLVGVINCHDRERLGWEFALRGRAKEAERAIEEACIARFGTLSPTGGTPVVRSDNGLIFQSRRFRAACRDYRLTQENITPYTPEQNRIIERFFRSLKEECVWQHRFKDSIEAKEAILQWIEWYKAWRPHRGLSYRSHARVSRATTAIGGVKKGGALHTVEKMFCFNRRQAVLRTRSKEISERRDTFHGSLLTLHYDDLSISI